jgi:hypothetical protein
MDIRGVTQSMGVYTHTRPHTHTHWHCVCSCIMTFMWGVRLNLMCIFESSNHPSPNLTRAVSRSDLHTHTHTHTHMPLVHVFVSSHPSSPKLSSSRPHNRTRMRMERSHASSKKEKTQMRNARTNAVSTVRIN